MAKKKAFEHCFKNPVQDSGDALTNILFINDTPADSDILRLEAAAVPEVTITLKPVDDEAVSPNNHHFKLTYRPGALARPEDIVLDASHDALWGMVCIPETATEATTDAAADAAASGTEDGRAPGDIDLYFLYKGDTGLVVDAGNPLVLTLRKVGAASAGGTRPTLVQLTLNKRELEFDKFVLVTEEPAGGPGGDYNLTENANLDLLAPRGKSAPTLMAGFISSDVVLNDGDSQSYLLLRIVNTGLEPISLAPEGNASPSRFTLRFDADNTTSRLWALGTQAQVSALLIPGKSDSSATDPDWPGKDAWTVEPQTNGREWTLTPRDGKTKLDPDEAIEIPISKIVTGHATGRSALRIAYSGLPGHDDGALVAYIHKHPLVFAGAMVGVGTRSPSEALTVETGDGYGITHTNGSVRLSTFVDERGGWLGTKSTHALNFFTNGGGRQMTLTTDGKLGIGTSSPADALTVKTSASLVAVHGITHTQEGAAGTITLSTRIGTGAGLGTRTSHALHFFTSDSVVPQVTLTTDGKLGIGTLSPSETLTVETAANSDGITHTGGGVKLTTRVDSGGGALGTRSNHDLRFFTNASTKMRLTTGGNLGIGTDNPAEKLHIEGNLRVNGELKNWGPFTFRANTDKSPADEDLARFMDKDGNQVLTLKSTGRLVLRAKPFEFRFYDTSSDYPRFDTGYTTSDWIAFIAGFYGRGNNDTGEVEGVMVYPYAKNGRWWIACDLDDNTESRWLISVMFVRRELVEVRTQLPWEW